MLTVCPTPIGNLEDVTPRQREALSQAEIIACEDSRRTGKLLEHLGISREDGYPRLVPYHEHNEAEAAARLTNELRRGRDVVLVSDAGTPGISDPGFELVRSAAEAGVEITALPGPCASIVALSASGLPTNDFQFRGFPPSSAGKRRSFLEEIASKEMTTLLYEAPHRIEALLEEIAAVYGDEREICVARELTKLHEEYLRGSVREVRRELDTREQLRGEVVVVIEPVPNGSEKEALVDEKIRELLGRELSSRTIKEVVSELYDVSRSSLYERIERIEAESEE